jgi:hypothetical protein
MIRKILENKKIDLETKIECLNEKLLKANEKLEIFNNFDKVIIELSGRDIKSINNTNTVNATNAINTTNATNTTNVIPIFDMNIDDNNNINNVSNVQHIETYPNKQEISYDNEIHFPAIPKDTDINKIGGSLILNSKEIVNYPIKEQTNNSVSTGQIQFPIIIDNSDKVSNIETIEPIEPIQPIQLIENVPINLINIDENKKTKKIKKEKKEKKTKKIKQSSNIVKSESGEYKIDEKYKLKAIKSVSYDNISDIRNTIGNPIKSEYFKIRL